MKRNIKVFVADYDGTLLPDKPHELTPYCISMINKLHDNGVLIGLASGKDYLQSKDLLDEKDVHFDFIIGLNGAEYYEYENNKQTVLYELSCESKKYILEHMMAKFPNLNPYAYIPDLRERLALHPIEQVLGHHNTRLGTKVVSDLSEFWAKPGGKIMFRNDVELTKEVWAYAQTLTGPGFAPTRTETTMVEFNHKDATKGNALKAYCKAHNIDLKDVAAFGDMDNDNSMLEIAGLSVAVKNATESTKKVAKVIAEKTNNEDGVADFIEKEIIGV